MLLVFPETMIRTLWNEKNQICMPLLTIICHTISDIFPIFDMIFSELLGQIGPNWDTTVLGCPFHKLFPLKLAWHSRCIPPKFLIGWRLHKFEICGQILTHVILLNKYFNKVALLSANFYQIEPAFLFYQMYYTYW